VTFIDATILQTINLHELIPIEVDDEMIVEDNIVPQSPGDLSLATAFNLHSLTFWAAFMSTSQSKNTPATKERCVCLTSADSTERIAHLTERLQETRTLLDGVPRQLRQWGSRITDDWADTPNGVQNEEKRLKAVQLESLRADLHVTHLWFQSILFEQINTLKRSLETSSILRRNIWDEREDICRQMLHVLHGIPMVHLEPNGNHLVSHPPSITQYHQELMRVDTQNTRCGSHIT
jgi:hypothetical protein